MAFSDKLKELMEQNNMKAVELARTCGLSEAAISDYLKGKKEPRGRQSIAIAKALQVSLDTLWETGFQSETKPAQSEIRQKTLLLLDKMSDEQLKYVIAFLKVLDEIEKTQ